MRGDPNRLQQVLWNLLTNAAKFTQKDGRVTVTLARVNSHLEIEVTDNGEGIDPAFLPHIFDLFTRGAGERTGFGVGLSVARRLVELHQGRIEARSDGPGSGSEFIVVIPTMAAD